jgi:hypothetical protein
VRAGIPDDPANQAGMEYAGTFQRKRPLSVGRPAITIRPSQLGWDKQIMTTDPDPYEQGQRAAREHIPAEGNPYQDGSQEHSLWAAGHEEVAGAAEADESEGT